MTAFSLLFLSCLCAVSVEDILSYGVKKKYQGYRSKGVTSSGRVLQELGRSLPEAASVYQKSFDDHYTGKEDYAQAHVVSNTDRKIMWIRVALVEGKLQAIVENLLKNSK